MPSPPTLLSGISYTNGSPDNLYTPTVAKMRPIRVFEGIPLRVVKSGLEGGRGGAVTRPTEGQLYPRGVENKI